MRGLFVIFSIFFSLAGQAQSHYVFVGGYKNEKLADYFSDNVQWLKNQGNLVSVIMPRSENSISRNADLLKEKLLSAFEEGGRRPLAVIAHSKGGVELVNMILRYPESFPKEVLGKMIVVQSPLRGSAMTEKLVTKMDRSILALSPLYWMARTYHAGGASLATSKVEKDIEESAKNISEDQIKEISTRLFYVRSLKSKNQLSAPLREMIGPIRVEGASDGLVLTTEQSLSEIKGVQFGQVLEIDSQSDHLDYFVRGSDPSGQRLVKIQGFTNQLVNLVENRGFKMPWLKVGQCRGLFL